MPGVEWLLLYVLLGAFVGFMAGLLGVGGGGILVPLLASLFALQGLYADNAIHVALGTSLACMILSSAANIRAHAARRTIVWQAFLGMAPGIILGAFVVTRVAAHSQSVYIALFFAVFMALIAVQMFLGWKPRPSLSPLLKRDLFWVGTGIGAVSALAAVGGGFLTVTYLSYKNIDMKKAIGTSAAIGFPIAIAGTAGYLVSGWSHTLHNAYTLGFINLPAFITISATSSLAAPYGADLAHRLHETHLKRIFAVVSLALSVKMLFSAI